MFLANRAHFSITSRNLPNEHFLSFHCLSLIQKKQTAQRAQFPANERTVEKWFLSNLAVPRAEIGKTSRFGSLEQKFARAEISVLLKLQVYYIYIILYYIILYYIILYYIIYIHLYTSCIITGVWDHKWLMFLAGAIHQRNAVSSITAGRPRILLWDCRFDTSEYG